MRTTRLTSSGTRGPSTSPTSRPNRVKLNLDWAPSDSVGVAIEYQYKDNDYNETRLGRTKDTRNEIFANLTYGTPNSWRTTLFGDCEDVKYDSDHRYVGATPDVQPGEGPNASIRTRRRRLRARLQLGRDGQEQQLDGRPGLDFPVNDKLMLTGSLLYEETDGSSDMSAQNNYGNPLPLPNYPNIKMTSLNLKGTYKINKNWSATLGYAYQKYDYNDDAFTGYINSLPSVNATTGVNTETQRSYLNGWNAFQTYNANIVYLTFKFPWDPPSIPPPAMKVAEAPAPAAGRRRPAAARRLHRRPRRRPRRRCRRSRSTRRCCSTSTRRC